MKRILATLAAALSVTISVTPAQAATSPRVTALTSTVAQHSYVTLTVHFSAPIGAEISRITATGYAGACRSGHCTYAQFVLVPYNAQRTVWIDTEVVNAPGSYVVTSVQLIPVAVAWPTKLASAAVPFRIEP